MRRIYCLVLIFVATCAVSQTDTPQALYERAMDAITGVGLSRNDLKGIDLFRQSANIGYAPAQVALGYYYDTGTVVAGNQAEALELYRKAAQHGDRLAAWLLGRRYFLGNGVPRDLEAAQKWLRPAVEQNNPFAAYYLARIMTELDYTKAPALYKIAAEQGLPQAQYRYAKALKEGRGIAQDRFRAYVWLTIAVDAQYSLAATDLSELDGGGYFSEAQITEAKTNARNLEKTVIRSVNAQGCTGWDGEFDENPTPPPPKIQRFCR